MIRRETIPALERTARGLRRWHLGSLALLGVAAALALAGHATPRPVLPFLALAAAWQAATALVALSDMLAGRP